MTNDLVYWQKLWDSINPSKYSDANHPRVIGLLAEYTKALVIADNYCISGVHGSLFFRLFTGHWNRHHSNAVINVISRFFHAYTFADAEEEAHYYKTKNILGRLKTEIADSELNSFGDLALIFEVIRRNTGIDYYSVPTVTREELDAERDRLEGLQLRKLQMLLASLDNSSSQSSSEEKIEDVAPSPSPSPLRTVLPYQPNAINRDKISVDQLKSFLMDYKSSSYFFGDSPEIRKLKTLCHDKIRSKILSVTKDEVRLAIASATGFRSHATRATLFNSIDGSQENFLNNTDKTIAVLRKSFN